MSIKRILAILSFVFCFIVVGLSNPPGSGNPGDGDGETPDSPSIPIDGGISLLLAAGAAYGAKKIYQNKKSTH